ncbi:MAG: DEAD/DEAH box helicase [Pyrinomonadaceae bacterium]
MPTYRFSWDSFDDRTVVGLAQDIGFRGDASAAKKYLGEMRARPDDDFVRRTKNTLAQVWLPQHARIGAAIVRQLFAMDIGPRGAMPEDAEGCAKYVDRCRNSSRLRDLLFSRLISFGDSGGNADIAADDDFIPSFGVIVPNKQEADRRRPYPHQEEAWAKLDEHLRQSRSSGVFNGVLVMPTGSGKTLTAANWLTRRWLDADAGNRVLWLAHREELLAQAARAFVRCAYLSTTREFLRIRQVSSRSCRFHQIDPADDIICCSVQSLARGGEDARRLLHDPGLFVVIDEAHHAPAKSYRDAIELLKTAKTHRLLGLTATPTRTAEAERPALRKLFGGRVIYQVSMTELIAKELLARPKPVTVKTNIDAETGMTTEDRTHLATFHEPSPEMLARLGGDERRNQTIVRHYVENAGKYGKTLVFTTDVDAAALLKDAFRQANVEAEYVASHRPDRKAGERGVDRRDILRRYADPHSGLDVLINVDMLTEGVDLPMTKTVFLARPTSSAILFRQMIGRALRGPQAGGNAEAHIVSFEDHWSTYFDFLSPIEWLAGSDVSTDEAVVSTPAAPIQPKEAISWDQVIAIARGIRATMVDSDADVFEAVPHGMYVLEYEAEGETIRRVIHVYDHQRSCWLALISQLGQAQYQGTAPVDARVLSEDFFSDCEAPVPSALDIELVIERVRAGDTLPEYIPLSGRADCDPRALATLARERDLRRSEENALLAERHSPLARIIYPTTLEFRRAFDDAMRELEHPESKQAPKGIPMFEPPPSNPLRSGPGPHHDELAELMVEVLRQGSELLDEPLRHEGSIEWSRRPIKGWYGMAWHDKQPGIGRIKINVLLDSADFSKASLLFLLWHEYLHLHLMEGHTEEFRRLERLWPDRTTCDRELDALNENFGIQYW